MSKTVLGLTLLMVIIIGVVVMQSTSNDGPVEEAIAGRWYSEQQVAQGEPLYQTHCASCHGPESAATPNWREADENGKYPPPPLNGTAHAWHHPMSLLVKTVMTGGIPLGGQMPPFEAVLQEQEIRSILAWIQTHWSDEIYQNWIERNG